MYSGKLVTDYEWELSMRGESVTIYVPGHPGFSTPEEMERNQHYYVSLFTADYHPHPVPTSNLLEKSDYLAAIRLAAAAPKLLAACKAIVCRSEYGVPAYAVIDDEGGDYICPFCQGPLLESGVVHTTSRCPFSLVEVQVAAATAGGLQ